MSDTSSGNPIAGACVEVVNAGTGKKIALFHATDSYPDTDSFGVYAGEVAPGSYKLILSDCLGATHATTYYGGADNDDFQSPQATVVTVTAGSVHDGLNVSLPFAGTISGQG